MLGNIFLTWGLFNLDRKLCVYATIQLSIQNLITVTMTVLPGLPDLPVKALTDQPAVIRLY